MGVNMIDSIKKQHYNCNVEILIDKEKGIDVRVIDEKGRLIFRLSNPVEDDAMNALFPFERCSESNFEYVSIYVTKPPDQLQFGRLRCFSIYLL